jgi:hypothetical protein
VNVQDVHVPVVHLPVHHPLQVNRVRERVRNADSLKRIGCPIPFDPVAIPRGRSCVRADVAGDHDNVVAPLGQPRRVLLGDDLDSAGVRVEVVWGDDDVHATLLVCRGR